jgi:hypothetical protein
VSGTGRIAAFAAVLALVSAGAAAAGGAIDPDIERAQEGEHMSTSTETRTQIEGGHEACGQDAEGHEARGQDAAGHPVRGLATADDGLRIVVDDPELERGRAERLAFRVVDEGGATVRDFDVEHERRMHLIVVRRDLTGFQHLHPEPAADGTWSTRLRLDDAGSYRLFADFSRGGEPHTLAGDLRVDGSANLRALPPAAPSATTEDGYEVRLAARGRELRFTIARDGETVQTEPYLGAGGHLVALREGDLAFLHVHPTEHDSVAFEATFPTPGAYRLFLQFKHGGRVHTAAFTYEVPQ